MHNVFHLQLSWAGLVCILTCMGCGAPVTETSKPAPETKPASASMNQSEDDTVERNEVPAKPPTATPRQPLKKTATYRAPFPHRRNLFEPIRKSPLMARDSNDTGESVVLKGFANVGEPKVVLAIDGVTTPLASGAERYGVRVISISPPQAVLQRGRSRWTATLQ